MNAKDTAEKDIQWDIALTIISDYKIQKSLIAKELGLTHGTITEKFNKSRYNKFTSDQKEQIISFLKMLQGKISALN